MTQLLRLVGRLDPVYMLNNASLVAGVTLTDRPKSVRNRFVIKILLAFLCCHFACLNFLLVLGLLSLD